MLTITDAAAEAITALTADAELPAGGGVRISSFDAERGVEIALVGEPDPGDVVVATRPGVTVFLEAGAAEVLDDKVLDVRRISGAEGEDELRFAVAPQQPPA